MEEEPHTPVEKLEFGHDDDTLQFFGEDTPLNHTSWMESNWHETYSVRRKFRSSTPIKLGKLQGLENLSQKDEISMLSIGYEESGSAALLNKTICASDINFSQPILDFKKSLKRKSYSPIHDHRLSELKVTAVSPLTISEDNKMNLTSLKQQNRNARVCYKQDSPDLLTMQMKCKLSNFPKTGITGSLQQSPETCQKIFKKSLYHTPIKPLKKRRLELSGTTLKSINVIPIQGLKCGSSPNHVTKFEPFSFDERDQKILRKRIEIQFPKDKERLFEFKAKEPIILKKIPFKPEIKPRTPLKLMPPNLLSESRTINGQNLKMKRLERAQKLKELQEVAEKGLEADIQKVRKALLFKATPVRYKKAINNCQNV